MADEILQNRDAFTKREQSNEALYVREKEMEK